MGRKSRLQRKLERARNRGPAELSKAADLELFNQVREVVLALMAETLKGNATSAGLLIRLAEDADWEKEAAGPQEPTLSEIWMAEAEWKGAATEEGAETMAGSREPE